MKSFLHEYLLSRFVVANMHKWTTLYYNNSLLLLYTSFDFYHGKIVESRTFGKLLNLHYFHNSFLGYMNWTILYLESILRKHWKIYGTCNITSLTQVMPCFNTISSLSYIHYEILYNLINKLQMFIIFFLNKIVWKCNHFFRQITYYGRRARLKWFNVGSFHA